MGTVSSDKDSTRRLVYLLNKQELDGLDELFAPDVVTRVPCFLWNLQGREELKAFVMDLYEAFPDIWWEIEDLFAHDETVVVRYTILGTHNGKLAPFNLEATGESFEVSGIQIHRFQDERIVESWLSVDMVGLLGQLYSCRTSAFRGSITRF